MKTTYKWVSIGAVCVALIGLGIWHFRKMRRFALNNVDWDAKSVTFSFGGKHYSFYRKDLTSDKNGPLTLDLNSHGASLSAKYDGILAIFNYKAGKKSGKVIIDFAKKTISDESNLFAKAETAKATVMSANDLTDSGAKSLSAIAQGFNFGRHTRPKTNG